MEVSFAELLEIKKRISAENPNFLSWGISHIVGKEYIANVQDPEGNDYSCAFPETKVIEFGGSYGRSVEESLKDFEENYMNGENVLRRKQIELIDEEEAKDYADFLEKKFKHWTKQILSHLDTAMKEELDKTYVEKTFGDFLRRMFNVVHTAGFFKGLQAVIKATLKTGIEEAEAELKVDIGFTPNFDQEADNLTKRQLDGFFVGGKKWNGLKGVAKDVQEDIREIVLHGVANKKILEQVKEEVKDKMAQYAGGKVKGEVTEGRAMAIARTETNRIINMSKVKAYKESGLKGEKVWDSAHSGCEICKRLNGQQTEVNGLFKDLEGSWSQPPAHPNCRCVVRFELE